MDGPEQVLVNDWCQQYPFHPGGGIEFGADGYLYVSAAATARAGRSSTTASSATP